MRCAEAVVQLMGPGSPPDVILTRECGKNGRMMSALQQRGVAVLELPLIQSEAGPDRSVLYCFCRLPRFFMLLC